MSTWAPSNYICQFQIGITYCLYVDGMEAFPINVRIFLFRGRWCLYWDVGAINAPQYPRKTGNLIEYLQTLYFWQVGVFLLSFTYALHCCSSFYVVFNVNKLITNQTITLYSKWYNENKYCSRQ